MEQARNINVDGISYDVAQFSPGIQQAVGLYNAFSVDLQKAQMEVVKNQAAMNNIGNQIGEAVKKELADKQAAMAAAAVEQAANDEAPKA
jgi:hypothetical protein